MNMVVSIKNKTTLNMFSWCQFTLISAKKKKNIEHNKVILEYVLYKLLNIV